MSAAPEAGTRAVGRRAAVRMCVRCDRITDAPVVVAEVHQNSGPGFNVYACLECAPGFPPVPDVLELFGGPCEDGRERGEREE
ncbi:hypothetical protein [Streptomyces fradiae]|uniref:hypothetical protein n=2 Tax=Streptomyces fradiae TaxID=1906 RepID=UPI003985C018